MPTARLELARSNALSGYTRLTMMLQSHREVRSTRFPNF